MEIVPARGWEGLARELLSRKGTAVLIGASDAGKSTLARFLLKKLVNGSASVCLVDADVGQSSLGLPAVIAAKIFRRPADLERFRPDAIFFAGIINPAKNIPQMVYGTGEMAAFCKRGKAGITLVDTTGLISGWAGRALKLGKIHLLKPRHIVAIEKKGELEHILSALKPEDFNFSVHRLKPSGLAHSTGRQRRSSYRQEKFRNYFRGANVVKFPSAGAGLFSRGKPLGPMAGGLKPGCLLGLQRGRIALGLGVFVGADAAGVFVKTPLSPGSVKKVDNICAGEITIEAD